MIRKILTLALAIASVEAIRVGTEASKKEVSGALGAKGRAAGAAGGAVDADVTI